MAKKNELTSQNVQDNAANTAASVNNSNEGIMQKEGIIATEQVAEEVANTSQQQEDDLEKLINGFCQEEPKEEKATQPAEVEDCECDEDFDKLPITKKAMINGQEQEIIVAFTKCNVTVSKKKADLAKFADKGNVLPVKYNFAKAELFWNEKAVLKDLNEEVIPVGTPNVYVLCPEPGTNCRIYFDEVLTDVEVHDFESVQDWAKKVGTTNVLCQGFDKVREVAVAALATGNEAAKQVAKFALEFGVSKSAAEDYLLARLTPKNTSLMMMGHKPKVEISLGRTWDEAVRLLHGISNTFGKENRGKCFAVRSINALLDGDDFDLNTVLKALQTIPAQKMVYSGLKKCGEKENCIVKALTSWIVKMQISELKQAA